MWSSRLHLGSGLRGRFYGHIFKSGRRQNWRTIVFVGALLHFHFGKEHGGSDSRDRHVAAFGAADSVEDVFLIAGGDDAGQRGERSADDIHAADEFVGAAIGVDLIDDYGKHLKRLRQGTRGEREATLNVVEIQAVGFALFFYFVDQFLAHFVFRDGLGRSDDQISLAAGGHKAGLVAAVAVRMFETLNGHARSQKTFQDAISDEFNALRWNTFIVEFVGAG